MKTQLLMIIAVILSSLLTISQRANAQEVSQLRWLEPTVEDRLDEVIAPDQDIGLDNNYIAFNLFIREITFDNSPLIYLEYSAPVEKKLYQTISPRAPPFSLI